jgi:hypothetical protein
VPLSLTVDKGQAVGLFGSQPVALETFELNWVDNPLTVLVKANT